MKSATAATLAILAAGQYLKIEFYKFVLPKVGTFYFHNSDSGPLNVGGNTYLPGLTITRTSFTMTLGLAVQSCDLTISPQLDNPGGPVTIGGVGFLSACRGGAFDGGIVTVSKGFFNKPAAGVQLDLTPGIVPWYQGIIDEMQIGRFSVDMTVNDSVQLLNVQMPKNILQSGCIHALYDAGCGLLKADNTYSGTITGGVTALAFASTALSQASGFFALGVVTFTSGVLNGSSYAVSAFAATVVTSVAPWATLPSNGDSYTIRPGCDKRQATCSSAKFKIGASFASNLPRFRGQPYVPQPETLYDGGTSATTAPSIGGQGGQGAGSSFSGGLGKGTYIP
jgi:hypothetical protein